MKLDPAIVARVQFAFTVSFHIIFPTISIGLATFLAIVEGLWLKTKERVYLQIYRFWLGIFAMSFGVGVVTGIVLSFEFGLGFARFAEIAGPAIGPMIAMEVLTSFFLEAGFLGIMLFGLHRVGPKLHFLATCMVALGTLVSASWILSANSWMQTPDGFSYQNGHLTVTNWLKVVDNPSWLYRLPHMLAAAYITGSFLVAGVGDWYLLRGEHEEFGRRSVALWHRFRNHTRCRSSFHRRHPLRDNAQGSAVQDAGGRGLLGRAFPIARALLLDHRSRSGASAQSLCAWHPLSWQYLADS